TAGRKAWSRFWLVDGRLVERRGALAATPSTQRALTSFPPRRYTHEPVFRGFIAARAVGRPLRAPRPLRSGRPARDDQRRSTGRGLQRGGLRAGADPGR